MQCPFCNADMPDENGICPSCGRQAPQVNPTQTQTTATTPLPPLPTLYWYNSWAYLLFALIRAVIIAALLAVGAYYLLQLKSVQSQSFETILWILVVTIPGVYFIWNFFYFFYHRFIQRYELSEKDLRLKKGFFNIKTDIMLLEGLWGLKFRQSFLQRFFGLGKITLCSDDVTSPKHVIKSLGGFPKNFDTLIEYVKRALDNSMILAEGESYDDPVLEPWHNSLWDFVDETLEVIGITVVACVLGYFFPYYCYGLAILIPVLFWGWLVLYIADTVFFTTYQLSRSFIIKRSGIFNREINVYILYYLQDCEMSQNLWQRLMFHDVGNITFYIKWEDDDHCSEEKSSEGTSETKVARIDKKVLLHGLTDCEKKFEKLREYWLDERHQRRTM